MSGIFGGGGDAPDYGGMNQAAMQNAALSKEALDWYKQIYAETAGQRADTQARANELSDAQLDATKTQTQIAQDYYDYQKGTFRPLEEQMVEEAKNYNTAGRRQEAAAEATADVEMGLASQQQAMQRNVARMGGGVSSNQALALQSDAALAGAKMKAGAANTARKGVETVGYARMSDAANLGRGLASNQATAASVALQSGNSSVSNAVQANNASMSGASLMGSGFNTALQGNQSAGNLYGQVAQLQASSNASSNASTMAGIGGIAQGVGAFFSSKKLKHATMRNLSGEKALKGVENLDVDEWQYKPGVADEGKHVGPYAEDMQREFGNEAAPGGKMINAGAAKDINLQAIRALAEKLQSVEAEIAELQAA